MNPFDRFLLVVVAPAVFAFALLEAVVLSARGGYDWRAFGVSSFDLVARIAVGLLVPWSLASPFIGWAVEHRLSTIELRGTAAVLTLFVGQEFCYYWYHRAAHRMRWFWCNHAVHHSPNELNLSAAFRIGMLGKLSGTSLFFVPLIWLGFDVRTVISVLTLNLLYQFWIHATWIPRLGWLEYVINTPSAHRVHHACNPEYLDANYGGVLILFDRLFGTYVAERDDLPCRYGLVHPMRSYNPLRVEFDAWLKLGADLIRSRSPGAVLGRLVLPPAWNPDRAAAGSVEPASVEPTPPRGRTSPTDAVNP